MTDFKSEIELKYLKEFKLGTTQLNYEKWLMNKIKMYTEELDKQLSKKKEEKQEFQLGDTAYCIDEDYRFFESEVYLIALKDGKYFYDTHDLEFEYKDIGDWVFKSDEERSMHLEMKFIN